MSVTTDNPVPYAIPVSDGAIDENLYCLTCGYNLRGLSGDPVRCPECGDLNDLGAVQIPANLIKHALRSMETAPTVCTACALTMFVVVASLAATWREFSIVTVSMPVGLAFLWWISLRYARTVFESKSGWRGIILDFHIALALCTASIPIGGFAYLMHDFMPYAVAAGLSVVLVVAPSVPLFLWGLTFYRRAQRNLAAMQREAAVRIARDVLRTMLHNERRRR